MRAEPERLPESLERGLAGVYLINGDEDLLVLEAAEAVRTAARAQGFEDRLVFEVAQGFDWQELAGAANSLSLFSTRRILELRMPSGKPGREGGEWLRGFVADPGDDLLILTTGYLNKQSQGTAWAKAVMGAGVTVPCRRVEIGQLPGWLDRRMRARGLEPEPGASRALALRVEGNLLAAAQEVDKIRMLKGQGPVTEADIEQLVADSARFDVFRLVQASLTGPPRRALRMCRSLRAEGVAQQFVVWAYARELRLVCRMRQVLDQGGNLEGVLRSEQVWGPRRQVLETTMRNSRRPVLDRALAACGRIDRMIKGQLDDDPWQAIERLATGLARLAAR